MKRIFVIAFIVILTLIVSACGTTGSQEPANSKPAGSKDVGEAPKQKLTVLTYANWNPFEYLDNGKLVGFDIDIVEALAKEAGYEVEIQNVGWDGIFLGLQNKTADLGISGITITDERKQTYDFSVPYFQSRQVILVQENSDIKSAADLKDKIIAVQNGSSGQKALEKVFGKESKNIKKISNGTTFMLVSQGQADAAFGDYTAIKSYVEGNPEQKLKIVVDDEAFAPIYFGLMFPKDTKIKADFDKAINTLLDNGTYASIYKKWFKTEADKAKINELKAQQ